ncbi:hypothetical protein Avbf_12620 [Armadillidium vulgare]|nr:hypothetical protein Avbf_12620 [Armadillidium vulgare]
MEIIKAKIQKDLPSLSSEKLNSVATKLLDFGVEDEYDLKYVEEKDLCEILKPIHVRKLLKSWKIAVKNKKLGCRVYNGNFCRNSMIDNYLFTLNILIN